jgi:uncharacterized lipoprotein YmbA
MAKISTLPLALVAAATLFLGSCSSNENGARTRDLANPEDGYKLLDYEAQHRQKRSVHLDALRDLRGPLPQFAKGVYPVTYTQDEIWARPVPTMLSDLLETEIASSGIFRGLSSAERADWLLRVDVLEFHGGIEEHAAGRHAFGRCTLGLRVYGPVEASGERELLRKEEFSEEVRVQGSLMLPNPHGLAAASFRRASFLLLRDLDRGGLVADGLHEQEVEAPEVDEPVKQDWRAQPGR